MESTYKNGLNVSLISKDRINFRLLSLLAVYKTLGSMVFKIERFHQLILILLLKMEHRKWL